MPLSDLRPNLKIRKLKPDVIKRNFKIFININYILGFLYAFYFFITTPRKTEMAARRLWAFECWIILSFYGLFIYLFYLEKSALEGQRGLFRFMKIQATRLINVSKQQLIDWFKYISHKPDQYSFESHLGVKVEEGDLMTKGSIFTTQEKFAGMVLDLRFQVTKVDPKRGFEFKVLNPLAAWLGLRGAFVIKALDEEVTRLELIVFNHPTQVVKRIVSGLFYLSPLRILAARQIAKEVRFIAQQVED